MSTEILEIVQQMDLHNAETQLAGKGSSPSFSEETVGGVSDA